MSKKTKNNVVIPVVASVSGILVLLVIAAVAIIYALKRTNPRGITVANFHLQSLGLANRTCSDFVVICKQLK